MDNLIQAGRITRENQFFFINGILVPGIINIAANYQNNLVPLVYLGMKSCNNVIPQGPQQGNATITNQVITTDNFINFTGIKGFNGYIIKDINNPEDNFSFTSGYLTSYNSRCSLGQIPVTTANISVLGNIGKIPQNQDINVSGDMSNIQNTTDYSFVKTISAATNISIGLDDFITNRILSYDLTLNVQRIPIYELGNNYPIDVKINWPIDILCSFEIDVNDYQSNTLRDFPCLPKVKDLDIVLGRFDTNEPIIEYSFQNMELIGESYNTTIDKNVSLTLQYKGYINPIKSYASPTIPIPSPSGINLDCTNLPLYYQYNTDNGMYIFPISNLGAIYFTYDPINFCFNLSSVQWNGDYVSNDISISTCFGTATRNKFTITEKGGVLIQFCIEFPTPIIIANPPAIPPPVTPIPPVVPPVIPPTPPSPPPVSGPVDSPRPDPCFCASTINGTCDGINSDCSNLCYSLSTMGIDQCITVGSQAMSCINKDNSRILYLNCSECLSIANPGGIISITIFDWCYSTFYYVNNCFDDPGQPYNIDCPGQYPRYTICRVDPQLCPASDCNGTRSPCPRFIPNQ